MSAPPPPPPPPPPIASQKGKGKGKGKVWGKGQAEPKPLTHNDDSDDEGLKGRPMRHAEDEGAENSWTNKLVTRFTGMEPVHQCCGCISLLVGIEIICLCHLLVNLALIANTSALETKNTLGLRLSPYVQVWNCMWALFGIPIIIAGGVGMLYRIESHLRLYMWYLIWSLISSMFFTVFWFMGGRACKQISDEDFRSAGEGIVCGGSISVVLTGLLWCWWIQAYCLFIVWSAAEECRRSTYQEVEQFIRVLQDSLLAKAEDPPEQLPWTMDAPQYGSVGPYAPQRMLAGGQSIGQMAYNTNPMSFSGGPMMSHGVGQPVSFGPSKGMGRGY
eukprot:gnl/MRDRNA2_/MRDRNA2_130789_c0_seq1.p1 gnl/MRDRNA2_/MRDRNA2_130789_c0~~gnl/MRDRNA2_/MRDRNA2_130789_c0_seq1.p1  ORF type:complete len:346 (-),score=48.19 gnl/MRDRNA2_/MRDRNA2_130789_c0_seq1:91-1083(-)